LVYFDKAIEKNKKMELYQIEYKNLLFNLEKEKENLTIIGKYPDILLKNDASNIWNKKVLEYNLIQNDTKSLKPN
jgi:hypothetical protein